MNHKRIEIIIDENGDCLIDGHEFSGSECENFIKEINEALGDTKNISKKKEYNTKIKRANRQKIGDK